MGIRSGIFTEWLFIQRFQVELEFRNVTFCGGRKAGELGEKPSEWGREPTTYSTHIIIYPSSPRGEWGHWSSSSKLHSLLPQPLPLPMTQIPRRSFSLFITLRDVSLGRLHLLRFPSGAHVSQSWDFYFLQLLKPHMASTSGWEASALSLPTCNSN